MNKTFNSVSKKRLFCLLTVATCFFPLSLFGQETTLQKDNDRAVYRNIKFAAFPFVVQLFKNHYFIQIQQEKAFKSNNRFTYVGALYYEDYPVQTFYDGTLVTGFRKREYTFKAGSRYYINYSPKSYDGLFIGALPFYSWENIANRFELRHNVGMEAVAGYQHLINRISLEANVSFGMAGSWYKYAYPVSYRNQEDFEERVFMGAQINVGYLF